MSIHQKLSEDITRLSNQLEQLRQEITNININRI